ncbi:MAG: hypothetical protein KDD45_16320 [Bdellovibrionales bacterium]|nr:hypothetical protein [Bdellovibrionales bacterium]
MKKTYREIINCCEVKNRNDFKDKFSKDFLQLLLNYLHKTSQQILSLTEQKKILLLLYDFWRGMREQGRDNRLLDAAVTMHKRLA